MIAEAASTVCKSFPHWLCPSEATPYILKNERGNNKKKEGKEMREISPVHLC
jgi:hypothetical protein